MRTAGPLEPRLSRQQRRPRRRSWLWWWRQFRPWPGRVLHPATRREPKAVRQPRAFLWRQSGRPQHLAAAATEWRRQRRHRWRRRRCVKCPEASSSVAARVARTAVAEAQNRGAWIVACPAHCFRLAVALLPVSDRPRSSHKLAVRPLQAFLEQGIRKFFQPQGTSAHVPASRSAAAGGAGRERISAGGSGSGGGGGNCFKCGQDGHWAAKCPNSSAGGY